MRYIYAIALVTILMSKTIYSVFWQVNFVMHQKAITEMECVNKDRPEMNCNGNCYLAKQLEKADLELNQKKEENSNRLSHFKSIKDADLFAEIYDVQLTVVKHLNSTETNFPNYRNFYQFDYLSGNFHPPTSLI